MELYLRKQLFIAGCIYTGQILNGYGTGWTAPVIPKLQDREQTPLPDLISEGQASFIGSVLYIGTITGPYITSFLSNISGRKPCLYLGGVLTLLSFLILAISSNLAMILIGRILKGSGLGIMAIIHLVYIGEIASTNIRGILLTVMGIFTTVGTLVIYSVGPYVPYSATGYLGCAISGLYIVGVFFIPETPVFQVLKGRENEAKETLLSLGRVDDIENIITAKLKTPKSTTKSQWTEIFTNKINRRAAFITLSLRVLQQMSGVVAVVFFATTIFELAGSSIQPDIATIIIGVTQLFASSVTPFFVERSGRKSLLLFSTATSSLSLAVLGIYFFLDDIDHNIVTSIQWLPLVTLIVFFTCYDLGFGIIPGTLIGEMFTSNVRSTGSTLVITTAWLVGFGVSTAFGYMITTLGGHVTFWIYSGACALAFLFSVIFVPETKGKSLKEIQEMLNK